MSKIKVQFTSKDIDGNKRHQVAMSSRDMSATLNKAGVAKMRKQIGKFQSGNHRGSLNYIPTRSDLRKMLVPTNAPNAITTTILEALGTFKSDFEAAEKSFVFKKMIEIQEYDVSDLYKLYLYDVLYAEAANINKEHLKKMGAFYTASNVENAYEIICEERIKSYIMNENAVNDVIKQLLTIKYCESIGMELPVDLREAIEGYESEARKIDLPYEILTTEVLDKLSVKSWYEGNWTEVDHTKPVFGWFSYETLKRHKKGTIRETVNKVIDTVNKIVNGSHPVMKLKHKDNMVKFTSPLQSRESVYYNDLEQSFKTKQLMINMKIADKNPSATLYEPALFTQPTNEGIIQPVEKLDISRYSQLPEINKRTAVEIMKIIMEHTSEAEHANMLVEYLLSKYVIKYLVHEKSLCLIDEKEINPSAIRTGWSNKPLSAYGGKNKFYKVLPESNVLKMITKDLDIFGEEAFTVSEIYDKEHDQLPAVSLEKFDEFLVDKEDFKREDLMNVLAVSDHGQQIFFERYGMDYKTYVIISKIDEIVDKKGRSSVTGVLAKYLPDYDKHINSKGYEDAAKFKLTDFMQIFYGVYSNRDLYSTFNSELNGVYAQIINDAITTVNKSQKKQIKDMRAEDGVQLNVSIPVTINNCEFKIKNEIYDYVISKLKNIITNFQMEVCKHAMAEFSIIGSSFRAHATELSNVYVEDVHIQSLIDVYNLGDDNKGRKLSLAEAEKILADNSITDERAMAVARNMTEEERDELRRATTELMETTKFHSFQNGLESAITVMNQMVANTDINMSVTLEIVQRLMIENI